MARSIIFLQGLASAKQYYNVDLNAMHEIVKFTCHSKKSRQGVSNMRGIKFGFVLKSLK